MWVFYHIQFVLRRWKLFGFRAMETIGVTLIFEAYGKNRDRSHCLPTFRSGIQTGY